MYQKGGPAVGCGSNINRATQGGVGSVGGGEKKMLKRAWGGIYLSGVWPNSRRW